MASSPAVESPAHDSNESLATIPTLELVVEHFIASKRSLSVIQEVSRAQEIVTTSREALEENAVLAAKTGYARNGLVAEVRKLEAIALGMRALDDKISSEFEDTIGMLDGADSKLKKTLHGLKATNVLSSFRPTDEVPKSLFDFVDESGVNELYASIKACLDRFDAARSQFNQSQQSLHADIEELQRELSDSRPNRSDNDVQLLEHYNNRSPLPGLLLVLEAHATETARHLEGLVKHYDLCTTALRATEGGGDVIVKFSDDAEEEAVSYPPQLTGLGVDLGISSRSEQPPGALSPQEMAGILAIIVKDATEVEDVVTEIRDRLTEMEEHEITILAYVDALRAEFAHFVVILSALKSVAARVPDHISAADDFQLRWATENKMLSEKAQEMDTSISIYDGFSGAYDGLIVEAQRRCHVKARMDRIVEKARHELEKLYHEDLGERESFRRDQAEYLPSDIWPGLLNSPPRYEFIPSDNSSLGQLPEVSKAVYESALDRLKSRMKTNRRRE